MADQRMIEIRKKGPYGEERVAVLPKDYDKHYKDAGWKAGNYEDGTPYEPKDKKPGQRTAAPSSTASADSVADSGEPNASAPRNDQGSNAAP